MRGIFINDNVYVFVDNNGGTLAKTIEQLNSDKQIVLYQGYIQGVGNWIAKDETWLYGGRVHLTCSSNSNNGTLSVDGVTFGHQKVGFVGDIIWVESMPLEQITALLNDIEQLGVDAVIENYKQVLAEQKTELEKKVNDLELKKSACTDEKFQEEDRLTRYRSVINYIIAKLSMLACLLYSGLTNMQYISACEEIIKNYFNSL